MAIRVSERGSALLHRPLLNKGTGFSREEREAFELEGLLPHHVSSLEDQVKRNYASIMRKQDPLERYIGLVGLQDRNETLFYRLILEHIEEFLPIVYTPTVGLATQRFSHIFRRARGIWITPDHSGNIERVLANAPCKDVRLIVVTDSERILGLGDQGAGGMAIPIGKLSLYTVGAGFHPRQTLPICLDMGTDNQELLDDPFYLGVRSPRLRGDAYDSLVEEFVGAVEKLFPKALLQWEDFKKVNAMRLLERYRHRILSFNDDIQGTAAVGLAGLLAGVRATGVDLADHRVVILGAGAAGIGIADQIRGALERTGLGPEAIIERLAILDSQGLLIEGRQYRAGEEYKERYSWPESLARARGIEALETIGLDRVVAALQPTALIGTSGQPDVFTESIVRTMASACAKPLVFPFSNPTSKSEAKPHDVIEWTDGKALVATGSPFDPVVHDGRTHRIGQGNNVFVFPGVGLGCLVAEAREVSEGMFTVAAETLAQQVTDEELGSGQLYPDLRRLRQVSRDIARAVAAEAVATEIAADIDSEAIDRRIDEFMWEPVYPELVPD